MYMEEIIKRKIESYTDMYEIADICEDEMKEYYKFVIIVLEEIMEEIKNEKQDK